ncbi:MAG: hypothetical protein VKI82_04575, partial [Leptolyngbya sp.]|nr:hypothetical protein [Leptolyngbya sp.]
MQRQQLEALIAEIDATLGEATPKLPWVMSSTTQQQRQLLAKARACLAEMQADPQTSGQMVPTPGLPGDSTSQAASQVLNALLQEMQYLRGQTLQILTPLQNEVAALRQQRESLLREVQQLQQQRLETAQGNPLLSPGLWEDTLGELTRHLDAHLAGQVEQAVRRLETSVANNYLLNQSAPDAQPAAAGLAELSPAQRLAYLQQIQAQTDDLIRNLDLSLRAVFDALQQSVYSYQDSLNQGLNKMHGLGQQGEMMFSALVNHLAQRMNQEALAYLDAPESSAPPELPAEAPPRSAPSLERSAAEDEDFDLEALDLDLDFEDDDDVTLLQIDQEISQLRLEGDEAVAPVAEPTPPREPLQILEQLDVAAPDPSASVSMPATLATEADTVLEDQATASQETEDREAEGIDDLYETLFGETALSPPVPEAEVESPSEDPLEPPGETPGETLETWADPAEAPPPASRQDWDALVNDDTPDADQPLDEIPGEAEAIEVAPPADSLAKLVEGGGSSLPVEAPSPVPDVTTIATLDELLPDGSGASTELDALDILLNPSQQIQAPEDEDLLADGNTPKADHYDLALEPEMVNALSEDLARLETVPLPSPAQPAEMIPESLAAPEAEDEVIDWATRVEQWRQQVAGDQAIAEDSSPEGEDERIDAAMENAADTIDLFGESPAVPEPPPGTPGVITEAIFGDFATDLTTDRESEDWAPPTPATMDSPEATAEDMFGDLGPEVEMASELAPPAEATAEDMFGDLGPEVEMASELAPPEATAEDMFGDFGLGVPAAEDLASPAAPMPPAGPTTADLFGEPEAVSPTEDTLPAREATDRGQGVDLFGDVGPRVVPDPPRPPAFPPIDPGLSTADSLSLVLSDLDLSLGPTEPPPADAGLTLDALESFAMEEPPPAQANPPVVEAGLDVFGEGPESPPTASPEPDANDVDPFLSLDSLLGDLRLDPQFPVAEPESAAVTAEDVFGEDGSETAGRSVEETSEPSLKPSLDVPGLSLSLDGDSLEAIDWGEPKSPVEPPPTLGDFGTPEPTLEDFGTPEPTLGDFGAPEPTLEDFGTSGPTLGDFGGVESPLSMPTSEPVGTSPAPQAEDPLAFSVTLNDLDLSLSPTSPPEVSSAPPSPGPATETAGDVDWQREISLDSILGS